MAASASDVLIQLKISTALHLRKKCGTNH